MCVQAGDERLELLARKCAHGAGLLLVALELEDWLGELVERLAVATG